MADIELVIKIPEKAYNALTHTEFDANLVVDEMRKAIANGTPLPKGHGELIDRKLALSTDGLYEFHMYDDYVKMRNYLKSIPTIIKADKAESEG
jgi:hypothetical protein